MQIKLFPSIVSSVFSTLRNIVLILSSNREYKLLDAIKATLLLDREGVFSKIVQSYQLV